MNDKTGVLETALKECLDAMGRAYSELEGATHSLGRPFAILDALSQLRAAGERGRVALSKIEEDRTKPARPGAVWSEKWKVWVDPDTRSEERKLRDEDIASAAILREIRAAGWMVAVHNDYRQDGKSFTFWLFTHPSGRYLKGEGSGDWEALAPVLEGIRSVTAGETA